MTLSTWWNRTRYSLYAPVYDWVTWPLERGRESAIDRLDIESGDRILILGCGTGSDLQYLPSGVEVTAIDVTPAMVRRIEERAEKLSIEVDARVGDARSLPFDDDTFDVVLLHLILSVVPDPDAVMAETDRVLAQEGRVSIFDKFVDEGRNPSLPRRILNPVTRFLFSDITRQLEPMVSGTSLDIESRESFLGGLYTVTTARRTTREQDDERRPMVENSTQRFEQVPGLERWDDSTQRSSPGGLGSNSFSDA